MKAGVLFAKGDIRCVEWETPKPKAGEVLIRVRATGICGSDVPRVLGNEAKYYPIILGHEFSGEVAGMGEGVDDLTPGQRVTAAPLVPCMKCGDCARGNYSLCKHYSFIGSRVSGSFAEYVCVPRANVVPFDDSVSFVSGAFFEPSTVGLHGVRLSGFIGGRDCAVLGGGTIGSFTLQWLKILGAKSVTVFDISDERLVIARSVGADYTVNTTNGLPDTKYDFVYETAGQPATMIDAFEVAANKASVCFIGTPHVPVTFTQKQWECMNRKEFRLTGSWMSYSAPFPGEEWELTAHYLGTGALKADESLVYRFFPLDEIDRAFALYAEGKVGGKLMLKC